ncbi:hypothetical protein FACS1894133_7450 [Clostridia bacterium]|nr:hypothetical protein FACS1894133_7450 [Clostridia bacterium]
MGLFSKTKPAKPAKPGKPAKAKKGAKPGAADPANADEIGIPAVAETDDSAEIEIDSTVASEENVGAYGDVVSGSGFSIDGSDDADILDLEAELADEADDEYGDDAQPDFSGLVKSSNPVSRIVFTFFAIVVAAALGIVGTVFYFYNTYKGALPAIAWQSVYASVVSINHLIQFPDDFTANDIYIRDKQNEYDVIIFATVQYEPLVYSHEIFHIIINKADNLPTVMDDVEYDGNLYDYLTESTDATERLQASVIKQSHEEFLLSLNEIKTGREHWIHASDAYCNLQLVLQGDNWRIVAQEQEKAQADFAAAAQAKAAQAAEVPAES